MASTILYEPPDWANYVAYVLRFDAKLADKENNIKRFVRISPLIHTSKHMDSDTQLLLNKLYKMDMDVVRDCEISYLKQCFEKYKAGIILNQAIRGSVDSDNNVQHTIGHKTFNEALEDWKKMDDLS